MELGPMMILSRDAPRPPQRAEGPCEAYVPLKRVKDGGSRVEGLQLP